MQNKTLLHFKNKITLDDVESAAKFYAEERLGLSNAIGCNRDEQEIIFKQNIKTKDLVDNDYTFVCYIKMPHDTLLEHSFAETGNIPFRKGLLDYIGWKLGASYRTEDYSDVKQPLNTFLTHPYICFNGVPDISDNWLEISIHYLLGNNHAYFNEIFDISPMNKLCKSDYPYIENAKYQRQKEWNHRLEKYMKRVAKTIRNSPYRVDYLFGDAIRCAIINSNLKIVEELLKNNFLLTDILDLSLLPHPEYISKKYLREISMPILCLTIQCLSSDSFSPQYAHVIKMMICRGANPYSSDYLGRDSLDYLLNTSHLLKKHKVIVFNEIAKYFHPLDVNRRIAESKMTETQKEFYTEQAKKLEWQKADFLTPHQTYYFRWNENYGNNQKNETILHKEKNHTDTISINNGN